MILQVAYLQRFMNFILLCSFNFGVSLFFFFTHIIQPFGLTQCDLITDDGLNNLHDLKMIEELSLGWCRQISDVGLSILADQPNRSHCLRVLRLARCSITDEGLLQIGLLKSLEELDLNGCVNISSLALANALEKLLYLTSLDVSYCPGIL